MLKTAVIDELNGTVLEGRAITPVIGHVGMCIVDRSHQGETRLAERYGIAHARMAAAHDKTRQS